MCLSSFCYLQDDEIELKCERDEWNGIVRMKSDVNGGRRMKDVGNHLCQIMLQIEDVSFDNLILIDFS